MVYVPGTLETDPKKIIMSLQQVGPKTEANAADIATLQTTVGALPGTIVSSVGSGTGLTGGPITSTGTLAVSLSKITASLSADVLLNSTGNYFDGPSIAQGTSGTWWVSGQVTVFDTAGACSFFAKLWDGTTVIASTFQTTPAANFGSVISLAGFISSPANNLKISVRDPSTITGKISFNSSGNSKDSIISAIRIA